MCPCLSEAESMGIGHRVDFGLGIADFGFQKKKTEILLWERLSLRGVGPTGRRPAAILRFQLIF